MKNSRGKKEIEAMAKCEICTERKARRNCPVLQKFICPVCCALHREEIADCPSDCEHFVTGKEFKMKKDIEKSVRKGFYQINEKIFTENGNAKDFKNDFEKYLAESFYENHYVNDHTIYNIVSKIYAKAINKIESINFDNIHEEEIQIRFLELADKYDLSEEIIRDISIKLLEIIKDTTGGEFVDRDYLRKIHKANGGKVFF